MATRAAIPLKPPSPLAPETGLAARVSDFARVLRNNGFLVSSAETSDALQALANIDILDKQEMRFALRCAFSSNRHNWKKFDHLFDGFWLGHRKTRARATSRGHDGTASPTLVESKAASRRPSAFADQLERIKANGDAPGDAEGEGRQGGASSAENIAEVDVSQIIDPIEQERLYELVARLAAQIRFRLSRRQRLNRRGRQIDIRRTLHKSVSTGGTPIRLHRRLRRKKPFKLVIFLDVSGSMDNYSRFFMRFIHMLLGAFRDADAFIFHTRLVEISTTLKERDPMKMMERMALIAQGWSGGTKLGDALAAFNRDHARTVMTSRTLVMILSDGFDTGTPEHLGAEMAKLRRRAKRVIWLNPLLGSQGYEPSSTGMAAALPHIDLFAPAYNLASLAALEPELARV